MSELQQAFARRRSSLESNESIEEKIQNQKNKQKQHPSLTSPNSTSTPSRRKIDSSSNNSMTHSTPHSTSSTSSSYVLSDADRSALLQRGLQLDPSEVKILQGRDSKSKLVMPSKEEEEKDPHFALKKNFKNDEEESLDLTYESSHESEDEESQPNGHSNPNYNHHAFRLRTTSESKETSSVQSDISFLSKHHLPNPPNYNSSPEEVKRMFQEMQGKIQQLGESLKACQAFQPAAVTKHNPEMHINTTIDVWKDSETKKSIAYEIQVEVLHNNSSNNCKKAPTRTILCEKTYQEFRKFRSSLGLSEEDVDAMFPPHLHPQEERNPRELENRRNKLDLYLKQLCGMHDYIGRNHVFDAITEFLEIEV